MTAIVIVAFCIIILLDLPTILKTEQKIKTGIIYFFLIGAGITISLLQVWGRAPTSPSIIIEELIKIILLRS